ncbi:GNAT family N-acetyltransferase [Saccharibacillus alkalitolerans]|uniref:GNAT family N-acetyltransferase n=1 Tax=Saccharibacillus alkalitolerans TaxID=2705290 RepID=A0ABX0F0W2_9BACL|nr:GNAT family N-acetyltransferase [Saccharibacillus alkalitolerans]NGZ74536.1 GNAT family N-acetyltransferase [Saccharibacillus alkalitolerans]
MEPNVELELVPEQRRAVIENLLQFYLYDFTLYLDIAADENGKFPDYPDLDEFWSRPDCKFPFLIRANGEPAGLALVERNDENGRKPSYYMVEFFVLHKFRRRGVGARAAVMLFDRFKGRWKVTQLKNNEPAQRFWRQVIGTYTVGSYKERSHPFQGHPSQYFES